MIAADCPIDPASVLDSLGDGLVVLDRDFRILYLNRRGRLWLGCGDASQDGTLQDSTLQDSTLWDVFPCRLPGTAFEPACRKAMAMRVAVQGEAFYPALGLWLEHTIQPCRDGIAIQLRDVTTRHRPEQALHDPELDLRRQLAELKAIYASAPIGLAVLDTELRFLHVNRRLAEMNGFPIEAHLGRSVRDLLPAQADFFASLARKVVQTGEPVHDVAVSGETPADPGVLHQWVEHWLPLKDSSGGVVSLNVVVEDVTDRLRLESAARAEHERSRAQLAEIQSIYDTAPVGLCVLTADLRFLRVNARLADLNGWPEEAHLGHTLHDMAPGFADQLEPIARQVLASGEPLRGIEINGRSRTNPDGPQTWLASLSPQKDSAGTVTGVLMVVEEVTETARIRLALRDKAEELQAVLDSVPAFVFLAHDPQCRSMVGSRACRAFLRLPPDANISKSAGPHAPQNFKVLIDGVEAPPHALPMQLAAAGQEVRDRELEVVFEDGTVRHTFGHAHPLFDINGRPRGAVGAFLDITELVDARRSAQRGQDELERLVEQRTAALTAANTELRRQVAEREQAEQALRQAEKQATLGMLASGIAHDFNNVLTAIVGSLDLIERRYAVPAAARHLATMRRAAERAEGLTRQLLAFSRGQRHAPDRLDANQTVAGMGDLLERTLGGSIAVRRHLTADLWPVFADQNQLELALLNLGINARDAMPDGGTLTIETANLPACSIRLPGGLQPGDYVRVSVRDTGMGMSEAVLARVLEPFFTTKPAGKGTGLGLSMVRGFAHEAGGTLNIRSRPDAGTTVEIILPRAEAVASAEAGVSAPDGAHSAPA